MEVEVLAGAGEVHLRKEFALSGKLLYIRCEYQGRTNLGRDLFENRCGFSIPHTCHGRHSRLEDSSFLLCDSGPRGTKQRAVIQADGCYHRKRRSDYVRAVQTSAQACFYNGGIDFLPCEPPEGHAGGYLEKGQPFEVRLI